MCGFGRVGRGAAAELQRAGVPFLVIDKDEDSVERAMKAGMLGVLGDASRDETLIDAGIMRARGLIATLSTDADNLFLMLSAKGLKPDLQVSRAHRGRDLRAEISPRGRRFRVCALRHHRQSHGAGAAASARFPVHRLHDQEHGTGRGHRAGAGGQRRGLRLAHACRDAASRASWA